MHLSWLWISDRDLRQELRQLEEEGKDCPPELADRVRATAAKGNDYLRTWEGQQEAGALLDETIRLPQKADYPYHEPSDLAGIQAARPPAPDLPAWGGDRAALRDRIHGAWLGRAYGCYLGKPVEGLHRVEGDTFILESFLKATGQWPLRGYFSLDYPAETRAKYDLAGRGEGWGAGPAFMPEDDDTNYTAVGLAVMERHGADFTPEQMAAFWLHNLPLDHTCTAERVAYRNFALNLAPPASATYRNPYREWIGAQIRGDFFGYAAPGDPARAAAWAWRDGCLAQVKNGIYGEMWVAAMLAAAYVTADPAAIIRAGLAQVPATCRLAAALEAVLGWREQGWSYEQAVLDIHRRWNERGDHDWCHTISNAEICAVALLWGEGDYATAISRAVLPGFDTDCNGATVGSIMGMALGRAGLPEHLVGRLHDRIQTGVQGYLDCSISEMAGRMAEVVERLG